MSDEIITFLSGILGIDTLVLLGVLGFISMVSRAVGKSIPDDATGILGIVRKVTKFLGMYVPNKVSSGFTTSDAAQIVADETVDARNDR